MYTTTKIKVYSCQVGSMSRIKAPARIMFSTTASKILFNIGYGNIIIIINFIYNMQLSNKLYTIIIM